MSALLPSGENRRRLGQLWSSRLWLVAAVLGAITIYSGVSAVHDRSQRIVAVGMIAQATAMHSSALASARLERLALEGFAPAGPLTAEPLAPGAGRKTIDLLVRRQREGRACSPCRDLLPVTHFFFYDPQRRSVIVEPIDSSAAAVPADGLSDLARTESDFARGVSNAAARVVTDARLGDRMAVLLVQRDDHGTAVGVYGMIVDTRDTFANLFARMPHRAPMDSSGLTQLDSLSLEVRGPDDRLLFGKLGQGRATAVVFLGGPLRDLKLTMAIAPSRVASPLLVPHSRLRLWNMGALMTATIVVIALAITASRRELQLERARSDFIAGISHDLRMPLAQILIASETIALSRERDASDRTSLANSIIREARRLIGLVDNVLLFSRSGAVELNPVIRPVSVAQLLDDVAEAVRLSVEDAGQTLEVSAFPAGEVTADARLVRQALVNLVDNALKYGSAGQRIVLSAEQHGRTIRISVDDEGPGIPAAQRDRIFEPYARLEHQASERTGTGLGLAVVREIAQACGGRVWVEERKPRGLRAVMELPA